MIQRLPTLAWLRAFEAAARHMSFKAAADELALTPAAVSHQIRSLEKYLGIALFDRLPRSVALTHMGSAYLPSVRRAFDEIAASTAGLFGSAGQQPLTIRCPVSFATLCLAPKLNRFRQAYPNIEIRLCSAIWADEIGAESFDVDIRFGDGRWAGYRAEEIVNEGCVPLCPLEMANIADMGELARGDLVHVMGSEDVWVRVFGALGLAEPVSQRGFKADTSLAAAELAASGAGTAMLLTSFAAPYVAQGRAVTPVEFELPMGQSHHLLLREDHRQTRPEALLFRDWLLDVFRAAES